MITFKLRIDDPKKYQTNALPANAEKLNAPTSTDELMKKASPLSAAFCLLMIASLFLKTCLAHVKIVSLPAILGGILIGMALLFVHEWLHAIVYPKQAEVTIGKLKGKPVFVALASYPLSRNRFLLMCLLPFLPGIIPFAAFILCRPDQTVWNGLLFGTACMGMISPCPDVYNVFLVLRQTEKGDAVLFHGDDLYRVPKHRPYSNQP